MRARSAAVALVTAVGLVLAFSSARVLAHKDRHTVEQLKHFEENFMEQVKLGDLLFHGDAETEKRMKVTLSKTGMSCAMCHPWGSDTHPYEFPKFSEQLGRVATFREMINWCIEKPNEGQKLDSESEAMRALEVYQYWSAKGSKLDPGRH
jgi:thiosulfate dehydrogenase